MITAPATTATRNGMRPYSKADLILFIGVGVYLGVMLTNLLDTDEHKRTPWIMLGVMFGIYLTLWAMPKPLTLDEMRARVKGADDAKAARVDGHRPEEAGPVRRTPAEAGPAGTHD